ncbi:MAG: dihydrofolate reductase, partial [Bacteroidia bacterium]
MKNTPEFKIQTEQFDDIRILRYQVPGFETLPLNDKIAIYYLAQAALWGRDILWNQNYKHNLQIRKTLENVIQTYSGNKQTKAFEGFMRYAKKVFFSNGIHHHYSMDKFYPSIAEEDMAQIFD